MIEIDRLVKKLLPDGVEYRRLGEIASLRGGEPFDKGELAATGTYQVLNDGINGSRYAEIANYPEETLVVARSGFSAGQVGWLDAPAWVGPYAYVIQPNETTLDRFLYHVLKTHEETLKKKSEVSGLSTGLPLVILKKLEVPILPLEVQHAVVRTLDAFEGRTNELAEELAEERTARKLQLAHYREALMTPPTTAAAATRFVDLADFVESVEYDPVGTVEEATFIGKRLAATCPTFLSGLALASMNINVKDAVEIKPTVSDAKNAPQCAATIKCAAYTQYLAVATQATLFMHNLDHDFFKIKSPDELIRRIKLPIPPLETQERILKLLRPEFFDDFCRRKKIHVEKPQKGIDQDDVTTPSLAFADEEFFAEMKADSFNLVATQLIRFQHIRRFLYDDREFAECAPKRAKIPQFLRSALRDAVRDVYGEFQALWAELGPDGGKMAPLAEICDSIVDGSLTWEQKLTASREQRKKRDLANLSPTAQADQQDARPLLAARNLRDDGVDYDACEKISPELYRSLQEQEGALPQKNDLLVPLSGARTLRNAIVYDGEREIAVDRSVAILRPNAALVNPRFLAHNFRRPRVQDDVIRASRHVGLIPRLNSSALRKFETFIPPLAIQNRIVSILDRFEAATANLTKDLDGEINARRKVYAYYHDKLLKFKRRETAIR